MWCILRDSSHCSHIAGTAICSHRTAHPRHRPPTSGVASPAYGSAAPACGSGAPSYENYCVSYLYFNRPRSLQPQFRHSNMRPLHSTPMAPPRQPTPRLLRPTARLHSRRLPHRPWLRCILRCQTIWACPSHLRCWSRLPLLLSRISLHLRYV